MNTETAKPGVVPSGQATCSASWCRVEIHRDDKVWHVRINGKHECDCCAGDLENCLARIAGKMKEQESCRHKFIDSKHCLKCGWVPPNTKLSHG